MSFTKATKNQAKARAAFIGVPGSGKTWTSLVFAGVLAGSEGRVALIDTENHSASKYADSFDFDTMDLESFSPRSYIAAIREAQEAKYDVLVIDSLSHAWCGRDGVLAIVDNATARSKSGNTFSAGWREATPEHNALVDALVRCRCHLIVTMRSKVEYVVEEVNGRKVPRKVGMAPVQRHGLEYEFDVVAEFDQENTMVVTKSRCPALSGQVYRKPDEKVAVVLHDWLYAGVPVAPVAAATPEQVAELKDLLAIVRLPEGTSDKWLAKAGVDAWEDMPADTLAKCIDYVKARLPANVAAA